MVKGENSQLCDWHHEFCQKVLQQHFSIGESQAKQKRERGHSDLLDCSLEESKSEYNLKSPGLEEFFKTFHYHPLQLSKRFIFIHNSDKLGPIVCNKLLKLLEDAPDYLSIFFLCPLNKKLLPTVESRALKFYLPRLTPLGAIQVGNNLKNFVGQSYPFVHQEFKQLILQYIQKDRGAQECLEKIKANREWEAELISLLMEWNLSHHCQYQKKEQLQNALCHYQQAQTFHNSAQDRILPLLHLLTS